MDGEFNVLSENTKTSFSAKTNNTATSDELNVDPIYVRNTHNAYAAGKRVKRATIFSGVTLIAVSTGVMSVNLFTNRFVKNVPTVSNQNIKIIEGTDTFFYHFTIANKNEAYNVVFTVHINDEEKLNLNVSKPTDYEGSIENIGFGKTIAYKIVFDNKLDYMKTLLEGKLES